MASRAHKQQLHPPPVAGSDALGLGQYLYRYDTETWQKVAQSWKDTYYSQSLCRVNVQVELESSGKMKEAG